MKLHTYTHTKSVVNFTDQTHSFRIPPRTDTEFLSKFIRIKKYRVDKAFMAIHKYYGSIYEHLNLLNGIKSLAFRDTYKMNCLRLLKQRVNGVSIIHGTVKDWDTGVASLLDIDVAAAFAMEELLEDPVLQVHGFRWILDLSGLGVSHMRQLTYHGVKFSIKMALVRISQKLF